MKKMIEFESVTESGPQDLSVSEAAIQAQSGRANKERDGHITLKDVIESL